MTAGQSKDSDPRRLLRAALPARTQIGFAVALLALIIVSFVSYRSLVGRREAALLVTTTTDVLHDLDQIASTIKDAETGQRGYLLTGEQRYLDPYTQATTELESQIQRLREATADWGELQPVLADIERLMRIKLDELAETIQLRRQGKTEDVLAIIRTDRGKSAMDQLRSTLAHGREVINTRLAERQAEWDQLVSTSTYVTWGGAVVLLVLLVLTALMTSRDFRDQQRAQWLRQAEAAISAAMAGEQTRNQLGESLARVLAKYLDAQVVAIYKVNGSLIRIGGYGLPEPTPENDKVSGIALQAARDRQLVTIDNLPDNYVTISSGLGSARPKQLVLAPAVVDDKALVLAELGMFRIAAPHDLELLRRVSEPVAIALRTAEYRDELRDLLEETQRQAEELSSQQEELRATNEELEQQAKVLQESQAELENQQHEVEQINAQLEEQASSLERQRDELARAGAELQRSNEYKSQFLANMSHELRTPLNSSLILAKLLADNREGNLNAEQIKFASTIYSAGNDLLTLINDILDLSKIEAGMLDVRAESLPVERLVQELRDTFAPMAAQKQLALEVIIAPGVPDAIVTDHTRVLQILRNLMSNALKFTERGGVTLEVAMQGDRFTFAVQDTGIGIPPSQHELIFEPFRQGDGGSTRKFGGTGLGLSISRDLSRLLGGDLSMRSTAGRGSTFTLVLPKAIETRTQAPAPVARRASTTNGHSNGNGNNGNGNGNGSHRPIGHAKPLTARTDLTTLPLSPFPDDRDKLTAGSRTLLVIEDDVAFARVLFDLAHELEFLAVVASTGEDGLVLARSLSPSAVVLDVGLPDRSGLAVLDSLKRDARTRHIPVHVVSCDDYTRTALEMGAAGYALKPVQRDELVKVFKKLESRFATSSRRVLVVEDDPLLRESTARLLSSESVETVTAGTTKEALELVRTNTFDCMVLDLSLPDGSGLEMLEEMARGEQYSFPPVIVYTGKSLTPDQVHALERFSSSIIIKGARSPERLLDEVTLFLHQVESEMPPERQRILRNVRDREQVFEGRNILVVEDDVRNVFALSAVLEPKGAKLKIARNGREALEQLHAHPEVDLVLMDIMMPEMDGLEATRRLRADQRFATLPVIALTAKAMIDDREKCLEAGANDYIAKPLDVDKLLSLARVWIRK